MKYLMILFVPLVIGTSISLIGYGTGDGNDPMIGFGIILLIISVAMKVLVLVAY